MNVLFICDEYPPLKNGGIGTFIKLLAQKLSEQNHRVIVYGLCDRNSGKFPSFTKDKNVTVIRDYYNLKIPRLVSETFIGKVFKKIGGLITLSFWNKRYKDRIDKLIDEYAIDIIETPDWDEKVIKNPLFELLPETTKCPIVVRLHGSYTYFQKEQNKPVNDEIFRRENLLYDQASGLISVSHYAREKYKEFYPIEKDIVVIPNGIKQTNLSVKRETRGKVQFVFFGTLTTKKGIFTLIEAWNLICKNDDLHTLHIYGKGNVAVIQSLLHESALKRTIFHGHVNRQDLLNDIVNYDVAVLPSYSETFGLAAIEAMNAGLTTIFTTLSTGPEIINHNVDGLLVDPTSVNDLVEKMNYLITNPLENVRLGKAGKERAKTFTIENTASLTIQFYERVMAS